MYVYSRISRDQKLDRTGMNPETQRRDPLDAGVPERNIHADIDVSCISTHKASGLVDSNMEHGDVPMVAALSAFPDTMSGASL